jgi:hypothetical protein
MSKKHLIVITLLFGLSAMAFASPIILLNPLDGVVSGAPGSIVGWGFTVMGDSTDWVSVTNVSLLDETNPLGTFNEYMGVYGGPTDFAIPPGTNWNMTFSPGPFPTIGTGLGEYDISPAAVAGAQDIGEFVIDYDIFDADPLLGGNQLNSSPLVMLTAAGSLPTFAINIVPEPSAALEFAAGLISLAAVGLFCRRRAAILSAIHEKADRFSSGKASAQ